MGFCQVLTMFQAKHPDYMSSDEGQEELGDDLVKGCYPVQVSIGTGRHHETAENRTASSASSAMIIAPPTGLCPIWRRALPKTIWCR